MKHDLKREDWDFSRLSAGELIPAVLWEMRREYDKLDSIVAEAKLLLAGKLSEQRPPMRRDKHAGNRLRHNINLSEADGARIRATAVFSECIPLREYRWLYKTTPKERRDQYHRWIASYLRPVLENYQLPWLCLSENERQRLCKIYDDERNGDVVNIGSWWDAVGYFQQRKLDRGLPLKFDYANYTSVLLTINWQHSKKRILAAICKMLSRCQPADMTHIKPWNRHGKKDRDIFVMLERLSIMRLLHHHSLSEIKRLVPDAWRLYQNRKWYDDRRQSVKDFRSVIGSRDTDYFPKSWLTKASLKSKLALLPAKQVPISQAHKKSEAVSRD